MRFEELGDQGGMTGQKENGHRGQSYKYTMGRSEARGDEFVSNVHEPRQARSNAPSANLSIAS